MSNVKWFPMYVDNDPALDNIEREFGQLGFAVVVQLFRYIYAGKKGYYCEMKREVLLSFADRVRQLKDGKTGGDSAGYTRVLEIIKASVRLGLFDAVMYRKHGILTSAEIQKNFLRAVKRRTTAEIEGRFMLISPTEVPKNVKIIGKMYDNFEKMYDNSDRHYIINNNSGSSNSADGVGEPDTVKEERSVVGYYLQVINPNISKSVCDILMSYQSDGMCYECLCAILDDCRNDNHTQWSYISAVLKRLYAAGVRSLSDYRKDCETFRQKKFANSSGKKKEAYQAPEGFKRIEV